MRASPVVFVALLSLLACGPGNTDPDGGEFPSPPETTLVSAPAAAVASPSATFEFSSDVAEATFLCAFDDQPAFACESPLTQEGFAEGEHTFSVRATHSGRTDASPATHLWTVDLTAPSTTLTGTPPAFSASDSALLTFESDDAAARFECRITPQAEFAACTSPHQVSALVDGEELTFEVRAIDAVGNVDASPAVISWTVDLGAPDTVLSAVPAARSNQPSVELAFSSGEGDTTFECRLDGGAWSVCASPKTVSGLVHDQQTTFEVRAVDRAGNVDATPAATSWVTDLVEPATSITDAPSARHNLSFASVAFTANEESAFQCRVGTAAFAECSSPFVLTGLADGATVQLEIRAVDLAGNVEGSPAAVSFTVDRTAPETALLSAPPERSSQATATVDYNASEAVDRFECRLSPNTTFAPCPQPLQLSGLGEGTYTFDVRAVDLAGNVDLSPAQHTWTVDLSRPETTITGGPAAFTSDTSAQIAFTADEAVGRFECRFSPANDFTACFSPFEVSGLAEGPYTLEVRAVDLVGWEDTSPASISWTVDRTPPETQIESSPTSPHNEPTATITFSSLDPNARFECRIDAEAFAACTSPHTLEGLTDGQSVTFSVRAVDRADNADATPATASFTVDLPPDTFITNAPPTEQTATSITFEFESDDPAAVFECTFAGVTDPCTSPVTYSGLALGEHTFSVVALDVLLQPDPSPATWTFRVVDAAVKIRIMASNLTSGNGQDYTPGHGIRIMQGVDADIIAVQEFDYLTSSAADLRSMVDQVCGTECHYFRENDGTDSLPNGIISRYPILQSGEWTQFNNQNGGSNRDYVYARIDIPGPVDLWVISVHLHSGSSTNRAAEANELVANVGSVIPAGDYVALAGDFNTDSRGETAISNLSSAFITAGPWPVDGNGNGNTNLSRAKPYDWVVVDADLHAHRVPVEIGASSFTNGVVIDTRVYTPLTDLAPAQFGDSSATNMQHMGVVRDFLIPTE